ncbi:MAG: hypothetical protein JWP91_3504 [Fibrobacteres bacterium]|nr:hypothetical protein [Fibrobacterota bacterium]
MFIWSLAFLVFLGCTGTRQDEGPRLAPEKERLIDALTLFVEAVQGDRYDKAMGYLTPEEKSKMTDASGIVPPPIQKQLKAVRLSTLASKSGVRLERGKLAGIYPWLPNLERTSNSEAPRAQDAPLIQ